MAPVSLSDSSLSEESRNLRNTLSDRVLSASPESDERSTGISSVILTGNETLSAYGFRVLPTGQTVTYAYTVTADAGDAARAAAARGLNEWMQTVDEMTEVASASIVSRAAEMDPVEDSGWIAFRGDVKDYGEFGRVKLYSDWYWVNEQNRGYDYFYTIVGVTMIPGKATRDNFYKNHRFTLTIDPGYSNVSGIAPYLPDVSTSSTAPDDDVSGKLVHCSLNPFSEEFSWTTEIPDASLVFGRPGGEVSKWVGTIHPFGHQTEQVFSFHAGAAVVSSQQEARNGSTYPLFKNTVDVYRAFYDGLFSFGTGNKLFPLPGTAYPVAWREHILPYN